MPESRFAIEANYKGETGYVRATTFPNRRTLYGLTLNIENALIASKDEIQKIAEDVRSQQELAERWDALTRITVIDADTEEVAVL